MTDEAAREREAKLADEQVKAIRESSERTGILAADYGVARTTIQRIRNGKAWA